MNDQDLNQPTNPTQPDQRERVKTMENKSYTISDPVIKLDGLTGKYDLRIDPPDTSDYCKILYDTLWNSYHIDYSYSLLYSILKDMPLTDEKDQPRLCKRFESAFKERTRLPAENYDQIPFKYSAEASTVISDLQKTLIKTAHKTIYWRITSDIKNVCRRGTSHGYGNPSSCWFTSYCPNAPYTLQEYAGVALLVSDQPEINQETGIGRVFLVNAQNLNDYWTLFNPYLQLNELGNDIAAGKKYRFYERLVATQILNLYATDSDTYEDENLSYKFEYKNMYNCSTIYINDGQGRTIHPIGEALQSWAIEFDSCYDPDLDNEPEYTCENCGEGLTEDEIYTTPDGWILCQNCWDESYTYCDHCSDVVYRDDAILTGDSQTLCRRCYERFYSVCDSCEEAYPTETLIQVADRFLCRDCFTALTTVCQVCGEITLEDEAITPEGCYPGFKVCENCKDQPDQIKIAYDAWYTEKLERTPYTLRLVGYDGWSTLTSQTITDPDPQVLREVAARQESYNAIISAQLVRLDQTEVLYYHPERERTPAQN